MWRMQKHKNVSKDRPHYIYIFTIIDNFEVESNWIWKPFSTYSHSNKYFLITIRAGPQVPQSHLMNAKIDVLYATQLNKTSKVLEFCNQYETVVRKIIWN